MKRIRADREVTGGPVHGAMNFVDEEDHDDHVGRVNPSWAAGAKKPSEMSMTRLEDIAVIVGRRSPSLTMAIHPAGAVGR